MNLIPRVYTSPLQHTAVVRMVVPRDQIQHVMGPAIGEVFGVLQSQSIQPVGAVFSHHFRMDDQVFDFEVGVPVAAPIQPAGRVINSSLRESRVVATVYHGPYEGLGAAWGAFMAWIRQENLKTSEDLWEVYSAGPERSPDPAQWCTDLIRPLED